MERIDLYDKYINDQLSEKKRADFDARLESDEDFASDFRVYLFIVDGICRETHQDNLDFGLAMKSLSKDQLKEIIGRKSQQINREDLAGRLRSRSFLGRTQRRELSFAAALDEIEDDDYSEDDMPAENMSSKKSSDNSLRRSTLIFIAIIILLIILGLLL